MPKKPPKRNRAGGAAVHSGINYQDRVAAWCAVHMLAESAAVPLATAQPVTLRFETAEPVDDVLAPFGHQSGERRTGVIESHNFHISALAWLPQPLSSNHSIFGNPSAFPCTVAPGIVDKNHPVPQNTGVVSIDSNGYHKD